MGYFVRGVASLESGEIVGIAATFSIIASLLLVIALVFLIRQKNCLSPSSRNTFSTIWVRKEASAATNAAANANANGSNQNGGHSGQQHQEGTTTTTNPYGQVVPGISNGHVAPDDAVSIKVSSCFSGSSVLQASSPSSRCRTGHYLTRAPRRH